MPRQLRFTPPGWPFHVWSRGNHRQDIFFSDADRHLYLDLLARHARESGVSILGYCLMRNHVHLVLQPSTGEGLSWMMMRLNSQYAQTLQFRQQVLGHFWQGRFHAALLDDHYFWTVMSYVELNPVRAGVVSTAEKWSWSSAQAHLGAGRWPLWLDREPFCSRYTAQAWQEVLSSEVHSTAHAYIQRATRQNRPMCSQELVKKWEAETGMHLLPRTKGRPSKQFCERLPAQGGAAHV